MESKGVFLSELRKGHENKTMLLFVFTAANNDNKNIVQIDLNSKYK